MQRTRVRLHHRRFSSGARRPALAFGFSCTVPAVKLCHDPSRVAVEPMEGEDQHGSHQQKVGYLLDLGFRFGLGRERIGLFWLFLKFELHQIVARI